MLTKLKQETREAIALIPILKRVILWFVQLLLKGDVRTRSPLRDFIRQRLSNLDASSRG